MQKKMLKYKKYSIKQLLVPTHAIVAQIIVMEE